jgi:glycosyltransferase involved in cell wall biosynthesis
MVTTFFGPHSFGGDAAYVDRLSRALLRREHEVHVIYCVDAFEAVRGNHPLRSYDPPDGLRIHALRSPAGPLSPLATQATGRPWLKTRALKQVLEDQQPDVIHFHNISLIGGPDVLGLGKHAIRIMTAHEHWLTCPMHLLWKLDRESCTKPECLRCMIVGHRPPQIWRFTQLIPSRLRAVDALLFPSRHALDAHRIRGISGVPMLHLPYFLPDDSPGPGDFPDLGSAPTEPPYLAAAGRLVKMKGFQELIAVMGDFPEIELRIAGTGPYEKQLKWQADRMPNVKFLGLQSGREIARLFAGARAVVVPSLFPETFGYVVLEAFSVGTPVIVHRGGGAIAETGEASGGGIGYSTRAELKQAIRRIIDDTALRDRCAARGLAQRLGPWSESTHLAHYHDLIDRIRSARAAGARPDFNTWQARVSGSRDELTTPV